MALSVAGRMNIVEWLATTKDDGKWDSRELSMLALAAKRKRSDSFTKTGTRFMEKLYRSPDTTYVHAAAKKKLFDILVGEVGLDPAKITGAQDAPDFAAFKALDVAGRFEFLKAAYSGQGFSVDEINTWDLPDVAQPGIISKEADIYDWADGYYREQWVELDWDMADYTLAGAMEDDYFGMSLERIEKDGAAYGYRLGYNYNQGEMGEAYIFDNEGVLLGSVDNGV